MRDFLLACCLLPHCAPAQEPERADFEVLVLGTIHAPFLFRTAGYTPAHVRAVLELARPDVVAVESHPEWFAADRYYDVTYEAQEVAVPWARRSGLPVYGVDWLDLPAAERSMAGFDRRWRERIERALADGHVAGLFGGATLTEESRRFLVDDGSLAFRVVNDVDGDEYGKRFLRGDPEHPSFGGRRNRGIADHCLAAMREHRGKRLVVVVGAGHKAVLDALFARHDGVRVLRLGVDVPLPTEEQVSSLWTTRDLVVALGHNLDGERLYFHPELLDLDRMERTLAMLRARGGDDRVADYYAARIAAARGDNEAALAFLTELLGRDDLEEVRREELFPFPIDHWRMEYDLRQSCLIERGRLLFALDRGDVAKAALAELMPLLGEAPDSDLPDDRWRARTLAWRFPRALPLSASEGEWRGSGDHVRLSVNEGEGSLCMTVLSAGIGQPCFVYRVYAVPGGSNVKLRLSLRGEGIEAARLVAYVWDEDDVAREIAEADVAVPAGEWQAAELAVAVPKDEQRFGLWVYARVTKAGRLWIDEARLEPVGK